MPLQATSGAASYDAFGGGVAAVPNYIEDVFSTYLYTGNGTTGQTINNGIDLTEGGLVAFKNRADASWDWIDTERGGNNSLRSNSTGAQYVGSSTEGVTAFNSNGFTLGANIYSCNGTSQSIVSWTFRKQPKFFDVVTYTGNGSAGRTVAHSLGSAPGCIIVKKTSGADSWAVYHRSAAKSGYTAKESYLILNSTQQVEGPYSGYWNNTDPTDTVFTLGNDGWVNANGATYVAYLFAHNAGGFGLTGTDNVISCGSFDANLGEEINLGYEPQWLLYKDSVSVSNWRIADTMRGLTNLAGTNAQTIQQLVPNSTAIEGANSGPVLTSTGFTWNQSGGGNKHIYIAIRRGPMKVPTSGTSVFSPIAASSGTQTTGFPVDMQILSYRSGSDAFLNHQVIDRLRGVSSTSTALGNYLNSSSTAAESNVDPYTSINMSNTGFDVGNNYAGASSVFHSFRRAPSFFDEVCYTGNSTARTINHNLGVAPELMIVKARSGTNAGSIDWFVYASPLGNSSRLLLNSNGALADGQPVWNSTTPTSSVFSLGTSDNINGTGYTYVNYLFSTCSGVSKVGSYTGNGSSQTINCGFTGGARFVMVKATSTTGNWIVADSARGIVAGNDPALYLNSTAAEVTGLDWIDADNSGFVVNETATIAANTNGVTYIFLAIA